VRRKSKKGIKFLFCSYISNNQAILFKGEKMIEQRLETIETRLQQLEKDRKHMIAHIHELQLLIEKFQPASISQDLTHPANTKIEYLTAANEQMFKQNQRLREYIIDCIDGRKTLDQKEYLKALSGE
jgi:hypothetical protein